MKCEDYIQTSALYAARQGWREKKASENIYLMNDENNLARDQIIIHCLVFNASTILPLSVFFIQIFASDRKRVRKNEKFSFRGGGGRLCDRKHWKKIY